MLGTGAMHKVVQQIRRAVTGSAEGLTDGVLVERFVAGHDQDAFAALVQRHGPMVYGVCRRVTGNAQDAEDAFQATFIVLVRRAGSLGRPEQVGNWLYGVAQRTALKARARAARRRTHEQQVPDMPQPEASTAATSHELQPLLDQALSRLPDKYRAPIVLCDLEGRSRSEVARQLRVPEGTLSSRLAAARKMLADRLGRLGLTLSAGSLGVLLSEQSAAAMPASLMGTTIEAAARVAGGEQAAAAFPAEAAALSEEVLQAMMLTRWKLACAVLLSFAVVGTGAGLVAVHALADKPAAANKPKEPAADDGGKKKEAGPTVSGVVKELNLEKASITVRVPAGDGTKNSREETFALPKGVKVLCADVVDKGNPLPAGKREDLTPDTHVSLQLDDKKNVTEVTARGPGVQATVKQVDATQNTITLVITTKKDGQKDSKEETLPLVKEAKVLRGDALKKEDKEQEGKLADLAEGARVHAQLSVDRKKVLAIRVMAATIQGQFKGVDNGNNTITITVKEDGNVVEKTFPVAKDAKLLDLVEGGRVELRFSVLEKDKVIAAQGRKDQ